MPNATTSEQPSPTPSQPLEDWVECTLNEIGVIFSGGTPKTKEKKYWGGSIFWVTPADLSGYNEKYISKGNKSITEEGLKKSSAKLLPEGSIIFSSRAPIGYVAIAKNKLATNQGFKSIKPHSSIFNEYVFYYLKGSKELAEKHASGTTFKEISKKTFSALPFPLPPLPIQRAIVARIEALFSRLDQGIADLQRAQAQLKVYRQAVLKKAFEGELTREWREQQSDLPSAEELLEQIQEDRQRYYEQQLAEWKQAVEDWEMEGKVGKKPSRPRGQKNADKFLKKSMGKTTVFPENWAVSKLGQLADLVSGITKGGKNKDVSRLIDTPYLRVANVQDGYLDLSVIKTIGALPFEIEKYKLKHGDILYTEGGDKDKLGRGTIWKNQIPGCIHQNHIYRARLISNHLLAEYIGYYSQTRIAKDYFFRHAKQTTNLASINLTVLSNLSIPLPTSVEQEIILKEIEARLSICDQVEASIQDSLAKAEALRQSILKKAFEGKLLTPEEIAACKQEADYEPAAVLLERIRAEKKK